MESILSVLFSVWGVEEGLFKRGREGILVLTNTKIAFVSKTDMSMDEWKGEVDSQMKDMHDNRDAIRLSKVYTLDRLNKDLKYDKNLVIPLDSVVYLGSESKRWGNVLKIIFKGKDGEKVYNFIVVRTWVRYPIADPIEYVQIDWDRWIRRAKECKDRIKKE
jgi:hypothetical protein